MRSWLVAIRKEKGLTQKDVAEKCNIKTPSYCNIENEKTNPSVANAKQIAAVLGFDWTRFFAAETDGLLDTDAS